MKKAGRLLNLPPYHFARWSQRIAAVAQTGVDVISLDIGSPDLPPPAEVVEALANAASEPNQHGYPGYRGLEALRRAIADYYARRFGVALDPASQVLPLLGSKEGIVNLALACLDPDDLVLVPDPGYAPYAMGAMLAGATVRFFQLEPEARFLPNLAAIPAEIADRASMMWLNYPNNPTGATAELDVLAEAVDFAQRHDILLCHDAPYTEVTFEDYQAPSLLQVPGAAEVAVEFNSLSKSWNMAGWRVGMAVGNRAALAALAQVKSNIDSGIFRPVQEAAVAALGTDPAWLARRNAIYQGRRELMMAGLAAAGLAADRPRAALYLWARIPADGVPSEDYAGALLEATGVAVAPGSFFGPAGEGYVRLSLGAPTERIREAMDRLVAYMV